MFPMMELTVRPTVVCAYGVLVVGAIATGLNSLAGLVVSWGTRRVHR